MVMKRTGPIMILAAFLFLLAIPVMGQQPENHEQRMEKYRAMKVAFFTEKMELTPEEAEKFWPLYNQHEKQQYELRRKHGIRPRDFEEGTDQLSEQEAEAFIQQHFEIRQEELEIDRQLYDELKKILPAQKILKLYITEMQFREYMLKRIREDRGDQQRRRERQLP